MNHIHIAAATTPLTWWEAFLRGLKDDFETIPGVSEVTCSTDRIKGKVKAGKVSYNAERADLLVICTRFSCDMSGVLVQEYLRTGRSVLVAYTGPDDDPMLPSVYEYLSKLHPDQLKLCRYHHGQIDGEWARKDLVQQVSAHLRLMPA